MKVYFNILIFLGLLIFFSCKKKQGTITEEQTVSSAPAAVTTTPTPTVSPSPTATPVYDTIFPNSYFPVFPKSTWVYLDQNNNQVTLKTDSVYKLDHYFLYPNQSDTFYVPVYQNEPVWGYDVHNGGFHPSYPAYPFVAIVSETAAIGASWAVLQFGSDELCRKVIVRDTSITIASTTYSPVIVTEDYYCQGPPFYLWTTRRFFAKNIGIIREDSYNLNTSTITTIKSLVSYTIGN